MPLFSGESPPARRPCPHFTVVRSLIGVLTLLLLPALASGQVEDVDRAFDQARSLAYSGQYREARALCREILEEVPEYHDVRILKARTWLWQGEYERARPDLEYVLEADPDYRDAWIAMVDLERWSGRRQQALERADRGLDRHPGDPDLMYRRAMLFVELDRREEALHLLRELEEQGRGNRAIRNLRRELADDHLSNRVELTYSWDSFAEVLDDWHLFSGMYERMTGMGPVQARMNLADRFGMSAVQGELQAYPRFGERYYGYFQLGYSPDEIFPEWRAGAELHRTDDRGWDVSLGGRYLGFDQSDVWILTASAGRFTGNWFLQLRPYLGSVDEGVSVAGTVLIRRYLESVQSHLSLRTGFGFTPEERQLLGQPGRVSRMRSQFLAAEYEQMLGWRLKWLTAARIGRQEMTAADGFVTTFHIRTGFSVRF